MREINNNQNNLNFPKVEVKKENPQIPEQANIEETPQVQSTEDLSLSPEAVIGRSQVQMSGVNKANTLIEADMKAMLDNPQAIQKAVDFFDIAYNRLQENGADDAYDERVQLHTHQRLQLREAGGEYAWSYC